jgi:hypothetical protein
MTVVHFSRLRHTLFRGGMLSNRGYYGREPLVHKPAVIFKEQLLLITVGQGPIGPRFCKNRLDKSCGLGYCRVDESRPGIQRQS